ncbi:hypothetical protein C8R47DRAFT_1142940 [Mycena vitilis]|nr:hypothetical protein C8R47DRAFT_1142940 [Mycena vitilis]
MYYRGHAPNGPDPPRMSGTKRAAQSPVHPSRGFHPSRMMPQSSLGVPSFPRHGPQIVFGPTPRKRTSYPFTQPLAPPQGQRPRQFTKRARQPVNDSPTSARRIVAASSAISAPLPVKAAQHNLPYWQVNDSASARATDSGRFPTMTAGNRPVPGSDYRNVTVKKFAYSNHDVRKDYDSNKDAPKFFGRKAARKVEEQTSPPDDDSTSDSSESGSDSDDDWESVPESDRDSELDKPDLEEDLSDDSVEIVDMRPFKPPVIELLDDTPPPSPVQTPHFLKPSEEIITAIEDVALLTECLQELQRLPFLKRNVRRGFFNHCRARGIPTDSDDRPISISVVFKLANTELSHEASVSCFECPLCRLHRPFQTKDMLQTHLDSDHDEVETTWDEIDRVTGSTPPDVFNSCQSWRLVLLLGSSHDRHVYAIPKFRSIPAMFSYRPL